MYSSWTMSYPIIHYGSHKPHHLVSRLEEMEIANYCLYPFFKPANSFGITNFSNSSIAYYSKGHRFRTGSMSVLWWKGGRHLLINVRPIRPRPKSKPSVITSATYEVGSVNRWQMDLIRKACDIRTWNKHLFLNISSNDNDTLVSSLYQCVETRSIGVFWL
jgi:hypothetical protein